MRAIPEPLAAHLAGDATTVCHCWRVTRRDGAIAGFTDHDRDLAFAGTVFLAASGFSAGETESEAGLAASATEVTGGFSSAAISEADLAAGRYDGARVEVFLVNWQMPEQHVLLDAREIGEVTRAGDAFHAELRSLAHRLAQPQGRVYARRCDAALGDSRCRVALEPWRAEGVVISVDEAGVMTVSGLDGRDSGLFSQGRLVFGSGDNAGQVLDIDSHTARPGGVTIAPWLPPATAPQPGDTFTVTAGCDRSFATCKAKFTNHLNFRGFPHIPGADFAYSYVSGDSVHDGAVIFE